MATHKTLRELFELSPKEQRKEFKKLKRDQLIELVTLCVGLTTDAKASVQECVDRQERWLEQAQVLEDELNERQNQIDELERMLEAALTARNRYGDLVNSTYAALKADLDLATAGISSETPE